MPYPYPRTPPVRDPYIGPDEQTTTIAPTEPRGVGEIDADIERTKAELAAAQGGGTPAPASPGPAGLLSKYALDNPVSRGIGKTFAFGKQTMEDVPKYGTGLAASAVEAVKPYATGAAATGAEMAGAGALKGYGTGMMATAYEKLGMGGAAAAPVVKPAASSNTQSTSPTAKPEAVAAATTAPETPTKPQESIEDLRKRFNLVEYGAPPRGQTRRAFNQEYKPISQNVGDGRGSFSQMSSKLDYEVPSATEQRIGEKERALYERGVEAATEDVSPVAAGTTSLPRRGVDIRRQQEAEFDRKRINDELAILEKDTVTQLKALRADPSYAAMSPMERQMAEDDVRAEATNREHRIWSREAFLRGMGGAAGQVLRPGR